MTMPKERTRALKWTGELLQELQMDLSISEELRKKVAVIGRHYPPAADIDHASKHPEFLKTWLAPIEQGQLASPSTPVKFDRCTFRFNWVFC